MVIKDGAKMSKSLGNVVDPSEIIDKFGPDTARMFMLFTALPEKELDWSDKGAEGSFRFLKRTLVLAESDMTFNEVTGNLTDQDQYILSRLHRTIKSVTEDYEAIRFSLAIGSIMALTNDVITYSRQESYNTDILGTCVKAIAVMLSPVAPHVTEELWEKMGMEGYCSLAAWPSYEEGHFNEAAEFSHDMIEQTKADIRNVLAMIKKENPKKLTLFVSGSWKYDFFRSLKEKLTETHNIGDIMKAVMMDEYKKEISAMVPKFVKDQGKMPKVVTDAKREYDVLVAHLADLKECFGCDVEIIKADDSDEQKAKQAMPGKPSLIVA